MDNKKHSGGGVLNTFFFGVMVGVLLSLLFTTKKGRRLLKVVTEEGMDRLLHWEDALSTMEKKINDFDDEPVMGEKMMKESRVLDIQTDQEEEAIDEDPLSSEMPEKKETKALKIVKKEEVVEEKVAPKKSKRLFRGIRRKSTS